MCFCASSRLVKKPVDSSTTSTPRSPQGSAAGSRSASILISHRLAVIVAVAASTSSPSGPSTESYLSRCAIVFASPRSLAATISKSPPRCMCGAEEVPPDAAEAVDPYAYLRHGLSHSEFRFESSRGIRGRAISSRPQDSGRDTSAGERSRDSSGRTRTEPRFTVREQRRAGGEAPRTTLPSGAPRSGPSRQTGSESTGGRARTRLGGV